MRHCMPWYPALLGMAGGTALMHAAIHGHASVVRELGEMGADLNARMKDGATAAMLAAQARV